jgi:hypothetical protein
VLVAASGAVLLGVSVANAEIAPGTAQPWIQTPGTGHTVNPLISETAAIQLWTEYTAPMDGEEQRMVGMNVGLEHLIEYGRDFEVVGLGGFGGEPCDGQRQVLGRRPVLVCGPCGAPKRTSGRLLPSRVGPSHGEPQDIECICFPRFPYGT